jgi:hypothetical protein
MLAGVCEGGRFVTAHGVATSLPPGVWGATEGARATLGLRPTDLALGPGGAGDITFKGVVARVEYGGADIFVDLALNDAERLRIRALPEHGLSPGASVEARIHSGALHLFGADGASLRLS